MSLDVLVANLAWSLQDQRVGRRVFALRLYMQWTLLFIAAVIAARAYSGENADANNGESPPAYTPMDDMSVLLKARCPHAVEFQNKARRELRNRQPDIPHVSRPALQRELLLMAERDQLARRGRDISNGDPNRPDTVAVNAVDAENLRILKEILSQDGFPRAEMVGYDGVAAAWLLLQHADTDLALQRRSLPVIKKLAVHGDLSFGRYAFLVDRVRINLGKPQLYGSQYALKDGVLTPLPNEDPLALDQRRLKLGLGTEEDYLCVSGVISAPPIGKGGNSP